MSCIGDGGFSLLFVLLVVMDRIQGRGRTVEVFLLFHLWSFVLICIVPIAFSCCFEL